MTNPPNSIFSIPNRIHVAANAITSSARSAVKFALHQFLWLGIESETTQLPTTWRECRSMNPEANGGRLKTCALASRYFIACKVVNPSLNAVITQFETAILNFISDERLSLMAVRSFRDAIGIIKIYSEHLKNYYDLTVEEENALRGKVSQSFRKLLGEITVNEGSQGLANPIGTLSKEELVLKFFQSVCDHFVPKIPVGISLACKTSAALFLIYFQFYITLTVWVALKLLPSKVIKKCVQIPLVHASFFMVRSAISIASLTLRFFNIHPIDLALAKLNNTISSALATSNLSEQEKQVYKYLIPSPTRDQLAAKRLVRSLPSNVQAVAAGVQGGVGFVGSLLGRTGFLFPKLAAAATQLQAWRGNLNLSRQIQRFIQQPNEENTIEWKLKGALRNRMAALLSARYQAELSQEVSLEEWNLRKSSIKRALEEALSTCSRNIEKLEKKSLGIQPLSLSWPTFEDSFETETLKSFCTRAQVKILEKSEGEQYVPFIRALRLFNQKNNNKANKKDLLGRLVQAYSERPELPRINSFRSDSFLSWFQTNQIESKIGDFYSIQKLDRVLENAPLCNLQPNDKALEVTKSAESVYMDQYVPELLKHFKQIKKDIEENLSQLEALLPTPFLDRPTAFSRSSFPIGQTIEQLMADGMFSFIKPLFLDSVGKSPVEIPPTTADSVGNLIVSETKPILENFDVVTDLFFKYTSKELFAETILKIAARQWLTAFPVQP